MTDVITNKENLLGYHQRVEPVTDAEFNLMVAALEYDLVGAFINRESMAEFVVNAFARLFDDHGRRHVAQRMAFYQLIDRCRLTVDDLPT